MFPSSGEGGGGKTPTQLGPLERANLDNLALYPQEDSRYSFMLQTESNPGP
jgi:hypothetical protein